MSTVIQGSLVVHDAVPSQVIAGRQIIVYRPLDYSEHSTARYPVLYLQDGQNLFNAETAFAHQPWGLTEVLDELISTGQLEPLIVVGIYNAGPDRISEYSHIRNREGTGGQARRYAQFVAEELKPFIDANYRTCPGRFDTGLGGSSMGGLVSFYIGLHYPHLFGKLIIMSPSLWWANRAIVRETARLRGKTDQRIWLDVGTNEGSNPEAVVQDTRDLAEALQQRGWKLGTDLEYLEDEGAAHDEKAWGWRMRQALRFHFPASSSQPTQNREPRANFAGQ